MFGYILLTPRRSTRSFIRTKTSQSPQVPDSIPPSLARFALTDIHVGDILDRTRTYPGTELSVRALCRPVDSAPPAGLRDRGRGRARRNRAAQHAPLRAQGILVHDSLEQNRAPRSLQWRGPTSRWKTCFSA